MSSELPREATEYLEKFSKWFIRWIRSFGELLENTGSFEKVTGKPMEEFTRELFNPELLARFVKEASPEIVGEFFAIMFEFMSLGSLDLGKMSPDEKIAKGRKLRELADRMEKLLAKIEKANEQSKEVMKT